MIFYPLFGNNQTLLGQVRPLWCGPPLYHITSGLLKLFCRGFKTNTQERLICAKLIIVFTLNLEFSSYSEVIYGTTTFKLTIG